MSVDLQALSIYKTKDYSKFIVDDEYNRDVNESNVKKIKKSITTYGDHGAVFPIVVDNNFRIIDGQHRFTARKEMNLSIYYVQDIELSSTVLGGINDSISKWKHTDFEKIASKKNTKLMDIFKEANSKCFIVLNKTLLPAVCNIKMKGLTQDFTDEQLNAVKTFTNSIIEYINWFVIKVDGKIVSGNNTGSLINTISQDKLAGIAKKMIVNNIDVNTLPDNLNIDNFMKYIEEKNLFKKKSYNVVPKKPKETKEE